MPQPLYYYYTRCYSGGLHRFSRHVRRSGKKFSPTKKKKKLDRIYQLSYFFRMLNGYAIRIFLEGVELNLQIYFRKFNNSVIDMQRLKSLWQLSNLKISDFYSINGGISDVCNCQNILTSVKLSKLYFFKIGNNNWHLTFNAGYRLSKACIAIVPVQIHL